MRSPNIVVCPDNRSLNQKAAAYFVGAAREAIAARGRYAVALAGGSTPRPVYELLASPRWRRQIDWGKVHIFWSDERLVPADHDESNYRMVNLALLPKVPVVGTHVHRIPTDLGDPDAVAAAYERTIRQDLTANAGEIPRLDLTLLGLGADGHTASLFPYSDPLLEDSRLVVASKPPRLGQYRVTMTVPMINRSRHIMFLVSGAAKAGVVKEVIAGESDPQRLPAQLIRPADGTLVWMLDEAAAAELPRAHGRVHQKRYGVNGEKTDS